MISKAVERDIDSSDVYITLYGAPMTETGPEATREAILAAAEQLFGAQGYRATTIEEIGRAAGVSRPLIYRYFTDKKRLYATVVERVLRQWNDELVAVVSRSSPSCQHTLRQLIRTCVEGAAEREVLRGVLMRDADLVQRIAGDVIDDGRRLLPELLRSVLAAGVERGEIRSDLTIDDMASVISELIISGSTRAMTEQAVIDLLRLEAMVETVLHGVVLDPRAH